MTDTCKNGHPKTAEHWVPKTATSRGWCRTCNTLRRAKARASQKVKDTAPEQEVAADPVGDKSWLGTKCSAGHRATYYNVRLGGKPGKRRWVCLVCHPMEQDITERLRRR